jgi:hypothetical protein
MISTLAARKQQFLKVAGALVLSAAIFIILGQSSPHYCKGASCSGECPERLSISQIFDLRVRPQQSDSASGDVDTPLSTQALYSALSTPPKSTVRQYAVTAVSLPPSAKVNGTYVFNKTANEWNYL